MAPPHTSAGSNPESVHDRLNSLCDRGRYVDAYHHLVAQLRDCPPATPIGRNPNEVSAAIRVYKHLCLSGHSRRLARNIWQQEPKGWASWLIHARYLLGSNRVTEALRLVLSTKQHEFENCILEAKWRSIRAKVFLVFRDFDRVQTEIDAGLEVWSDHPWLFVDQASLHVRKDQLPQALEVCQETLRRWPDYAPMRNLECSILHESSQNEAAVEAYARASAEFQSPSVDLGYANCLLQQDRFEETQTQLESTLERFEMLGRKTRQRIHRSLAFTARMQGRNSECLEQARLSGKLGKKLVESIERSGGSGERVKLDVPFVRQDHMTCAPATMASLLAYSGIEVDQREIADKITYDGTPHYEQMRWAESRGLIVKFFEFDIELTHQLIDRGVPFALSTRWSTGAHLQGVIGYDALLGTVLIREPGNHAIHELSAQTLLEEMRARGGMCCIIAPESWGDRLPEDGLPYEREYHASVEFSQDISEHKLESARKHLPLLRSLPPSPMRWDTERMWAYELGDEKGGLRYWREQLAAFPDDETCIYHTALALRQADLWTEYAEFLETQALRREAPHVLRLLLADNLSHYAGTHSRAVHIALTTARKMHMSDDVASSLGGIFWESHDDREFATELYHGAATSADLDENRAASYFRALDQQGRGDEGLEFLRKRHTRLIDRKADCAGSLSEALVQRHDLENARDVLIHALDKHESRWIRSLLFDRLLQLREFDRAEQHLLDSEKVLRQGSVEQCRYRLALARGDHPAALAALDQLLTINPEDANSHSKRLRLILELEGVDRARSTAEELVLEHPDHFVLQGEIADFFNSDLRERDASVRIVRRMVEANPGEFWLQGKLCRTLLTSGKTEEALAIGESLIADYGNSAALWHDIGYGRLMQGNSKGAQEAYRRSLELQHNNSNAFYQWLQTCQSREEALAAARFLASRFKERVPDGGILRSWLSLTEDLLEDDERIAVLEGLESEYRGDPDIGEAHCSLLMDKEDYDGALSVAEKLVDRFPWSNDAHILLAQVNLKQDNFDSARTRFFDVIERDPGCQDAFVYLGEALEQRGELVEAQKIYEQGLETNRTANLYGYLADLHWRCRRAEEALTAVARANELDPSYGWGLHAHIRWLCELGRDDEALIVASKAAEKNPSWATAHLVHAKVLTEVGQHKESVDALYAALRIDPRLGSARPTLVRSLGGLGRFDEAHTIVSEGIELLGDDESLMLESFRLERSKGDHGGACTQLCNYLADHADWTAGWFEYLRWLNADGRTDDILAVYADHPEELDSAAALHGYAARAFIEKLEIDKAEQALRRALEIDEDYDWARMTLGGILRNSKRKREETKLYKSLQEPNASSDGLAVRVARSAMEQGDADRAERFLARVLREPYPDFDILAAIAKRDDKKKTGLIDRTAKACIPDDSTGYVRANLAGTYAELGDKAKFWKTLNQLWQDESLVDREDRTAYVLGSARDTALEDALPQWILDKVKPPVSNSFLWGAIGLAFQASDDRHHEDVVRYLLADYQHPGVEGWMLANLSTSLRHLERFDDMCKVSRFALSLPTDHSKWWHRMFLAYDRIVAEDYQAVLKYTDMPVADHWETKLDTFAMETVARLHLANNKAARRQILTRHIPVILGLWDRAVDSGDELDNDSIHAIRVFKASPNLSTYLLRFKLGRILLGWKHKRRAGGICNSLNGNPS